LGDRGRAVLASGADRGLPEGPGARERISGVTPRTQKPESGRERSLYTPS
jgi:hypothetical protein